jgi:hypothetical protein
MTALFLAADRSMRRIDADGHLHVEMTNISKANVCPYLGREIPDNEKLGLKPDRVYLLYRDPAELAAAAPSFAGKPLLIHHIPVTADEPASELVVGSIGTDVRFDAPYLRAPLTVWTQPAIELIDSREQEQLSSSYRYRADMTSGRSPEGVAYDGVMRDIKANHVALVAKGRAGPDVVVADQVPVELSNMRFPKLIAAIASLFATAPKPEHLIALDAALDEDLEDKAALDALTDEDRKTALDALCANLGKAMDALTDEEKTEAYKRAAKDKRAKDGKVPHLKPPGMDEAAVKVAVDTAVAKATEGMISKVDADAATKIAVDAAVTSTVALYEARQAVEPTCGVIALDSAESVFRFALDALKVDHKEVPATALKALYEASVKAGSVNPAVAQDSAPALDIRKLFPGLQNIRKG